MRHPILTKRLRIQELTESMAMSVHLLSLDEDNRRFIPDEVFETVDDALEAIRRLRSYYGRNDAPLVYALALHDGQHIGHIQAIPIEQSWEIGYHIGKAYTGRGYAAEAVSAFVPLVMEQLGIRRLFGVCLTDNIASRRVMEKCGFSLKSSGEAPYHGEMRAVCHYAYDGPRMPDTGGTEST